MTEGPAPPTPFRLRFPAARTTRALSIVVVVLLAIHIAFQYDRFYTHHLPWEIHALFDLDEEQSVPTWYSAALLAFAALLTAAVAHARRVTRDRDAWRWAFLAGVMTYLSFDEIAGVHETVNSLSPISWTVPFGLLAIVVGSLFLPFLARQPARTRWGFVAAGVVYLGGAAGVELLTAQWFDESNKRQFLYALFVPVEEGMEMFGAVIMIHTLLRLMEREAGSAEVDVAARN
jgi:hypothetical protein